MIRRLAGLVCFVAACESAAASDELPTAAKSALARAVAFYAEHAAHHGGYVYRYSADLKKSEGEGQSGPDTVWVQPPGTPAVGLAFLEAYERTGDAACWKSAQAAGECLLQGQLQSGGWQDRIEFAADERAKVAYRTHARIGQRAKNNSTFDDDKTQSALRFLMRLDQAEKLQNERLHEAVLYALDSILKAQRPNGGWPQVWTEPADPAKFPIKPASFPESWPRAFPGGQYWNAYTLNDNAIADTVDMLWIAGDVYRDERYRQSAIKAGEFLIAAQLPEPQPAWAQQYDTEMHPCWARKFEPPAITGGESQGAIASLMRLYVETGNQKFLAPIPRALAYLKRSQLPDGRLARFYELHTNKPLYFTKTYELVYDDDDLPTHYGFKTPSRLNKFARDYERLAKLSPDELPRERQQLREKNRARPSDAEVQRIIAALDDRGAWVENGKLRYHGKDDDTTRVIDSQTFIRNLDALSRYIAGSRTPN